METKPRVWSLEEELFLVKEYGKLSAREIAEKLNKTIYQVYSKIQRMKNKGLIEDKEDIRLKKIAKKKELKDMREGLDFSKLKLDKQKKYKVDRKKNNRGDYERHLVGYIVQETKELVTFRSETGYCESFRKGCLMCGDYRAKEVAN